MAHKKNIFFILLSVILHTACANNIYYEELQAFKETKEVFHNDLNPRLVALRELNQCFENYKNLSFAQQLFAPLTMLNFGIIVTQETMPKLYTYVSDICTKSRIQVPLIFICTRPGLFNAFAQESFPFLGSILIGQEFLNLTQEETEAIIAHELGHIKHSHSSQISALRILLLFIFACSHKYIPTCMSTFPTNAFCAILCAKLLINKTFEKEADLFACQQGKAEGIKTFFSNSHNAEQQEAIAFEQTLDDIKASRDIVSGAVYYCNMMPLYYGSKLERYIQNGMKWLYHHTPLGAHPCNEARVKAAQDYIDAHAS